MTTKNNLLFGKKLKSSVLKGDVDKFVQELVQVSKRLNIDPNWLMAVMDLETGGTFNPAIQNTLGYTGLIQFGNVAAKEVGTTTTELKKMSGITQLTFIEKYLSKFKGILITLLDVYLAVFFPAALKKIDNWVLHTKNLTPQQIAKWNPLFDINKDGQIQIWEIRAKLNLRLPDKFRPLNY